jgi:hypothetical protein
MNIKRLIPILLIIALVIWLLVSIEGTLSNTVIQGVNARYLETTRSEIPADYCEEAGLWYAAQYHAAPDILPYCR